MGIRNWQGGGRASARETIGRVAAGAVAKKVMADLFPALEIVAYVKSIHALVAEVDPDTVKFAEVEANIVRCPDAAMAARMIDFIKEVRSEGDSVGGRDRVRFARRAARTRRAGVRQAGGGPGARHDELAGHEGIRDRVGIRGSAASRVRAQRSLCHGSRPRADDDESLGRCAGRASAMGRRSFSASPSSPPPRFSARKRRSR